MAPTVQSNNPFGQLFDLKAQVYASPSYVSPRAGTEVRGLFHVKTNPNTVTAQAQKGATETVAVLVIDNSSSMHGAGITAARATGKAGVNGTANGNRLGIITFAGSGSAHWLFPITVMDDGVRKKMLAAIDKMDASGSTCFSQPLDIVIRELQKCGTAMYIEIDLLTDGESTAGGLDVGGKYESDVPATLWLAENMIKGKYELKAYGMGNSYDAAFMTDLVNRADGLLYHIKSDGSGMDTVVGGNIARAGHAAAVNVVVEIRLLNDFRFKRDPKDNSRCELRRTKPQPLQLHPLNDSLMVDDVGTVNSVEGIPYEFTLVGPSLTPPPGQQTWTMPVAQLTIRYDLGTGSYEESLVLEQEFTKDLNLVQVDQTVAQTMQQSALLVRTSELIDAYTAAQAAGDAEGIRQATMALTSVQATAVKSQLGQLSADLGDVIQGMSSGDADQVKGKQTQMMNSADLDAFTGGMHSGGKDDNK